MSPLTPRASDLQGSAQTLRAFLHHPEAETAQRGSAWIKANPVVSDL